MNERNVEPLAHRSRQAWLSRALVLWSDAPRHTRACKYAYTCVCVLSSRPVPLPSHLVPWRLVPCYPVRPEKNIGRSLVNYIPSTMERLYSRIVRPVVNEQRVASRPILRSTRRYYDISILLMYSNALYRV